MGLTRSMKRAAARRFGHEWKSSNPMPQTKFEDGRGYRYHPTKGWRTDNSVTK